MTSLIFRLVVCLCITIGISDNLMAQKLGAAHLPPKSDNMPSWALLLYQKPLNVHVLEAAYNDYYKTHKFEKSVYTLFYRRLVKENKQNIQEDGTILEEQSTPTEVSNREMMVTNRSAGWRVIGPLETYPLAFDEPAQPSKAWQVNIYAFDVALTNHNILYAGVSTGGIYKTTDKGMNWVSVADNYNLGVVTALTIHPTDPNIVYAGTSNKIYKTTDGGTTWNTVYTLSGLETSDIAIVPSTPNTIFHAGELGLRKSTNGGATWTVVPNVNKMVYDIEINPVNNNSIYILHQNTTTSLTEFWYSANMGTSFGPSISGWTTGTGEPARMTVTPADTNRIYAVLLMETPIEGPAIMRSTNGGKTWTKTVQSTETGLIGSETGPLGMSNGQHFYDLNIMASSTNANEVIVGTTSAYKSTDGGLNFTAVGGYNGDFEIHPDIQEMKMIDNDAWISTDGGLNLSSDFYTSLSNHSVRINGIYGSPYWGFGQGWNEDILCGGRYHNGNAVMYETYPAGKALLLGGGEAATGYVLHGHERHVLHSDIDGDIVPATFTSGEWSSFNFGKYPNEDGYGDDASEMEFYPSCYNHIYLGEGKSLWKSTDGGTTFIEIHLFNSPVRKFEISRSNPNVMYVATDLNLWKTTNGGTSWSALTVPASTIYEMSIALSFTDENTLWITGPDASLNNRVFKSTNGGASWVNITTPTINGQGYYNIVHQAGTDGGVYIIVASGGTIFYKNNTMPDWVDFSMNLPKGFNITALRPFYKKGKLRAAGNRGIWEADFYEPSALIAQPTVNLLTSNCLRDTFYFDDFSVLNHTGATWNWTFTPTPQYVSSTSVRNPKVVFNTLGNYSVSLTVANASGTSTKSITNMVSVTTDYCAAQTTPTTMASFTGAANSNFKGATEAPNFGLSQDFSVAFWFKSASTSGDAAMITDKNWNSGSYNGWVFSLSSGKVWFNIGDGEEHKIDLKSATGFNDNAWHHAAASVSRTGNAVLYVDGVNVASTSAAALMTIQSGYPLTMGMDPNGNWVYNGQLDEVKIWNVALSQDQIREKMHLTTGSSEPNLIHYYQFNDATTTEYDRAGGSYNLTMGAAASRTSSTAPVGSGTSYRMTVNSSGEKDFTGTDCQMTFPATGIYPNGEVVVSKITVAPDQNPTGGTPLSTAYWIIRNYGTNTSFSPLTSLKFSNLTGATSPATNYKLYKRAANAHGATWGKTLDGGDILASNALTFTPVASCLGITTFGQFSITDDATTATPTASCVAQATPTNAASLTGVATSNIQSTVNAPNFGASQNFTISFWFKSASTSSDAALLTDKNWNSGLNKGWVFALQSGILTLNIGDGNSHRIDITSQIALNDNKWHHVAASVTRTGLAILYIDGVNKASKSATVLLDIYSGNKLFIGTDVNNNYAYAGLIDEIKIWDKALTEAEIREKRHLTTTPSETNLISYYQFNATSGTEYDISNPLNALTFNTNASRTTATTPVGGGVSTTLNVTTSGVKTFTGTDCEIEFAAGTSPNGDIVVSKLNVAPNLNPADGTPLSNQYWIVNNYGTNASFSTLTNIKFSNLGTSASGLPSNFKLFKRTSNSDASWGASIDVADALTTANNNTLTFSTGNNITSFSQFALSSMAVLPIELLSFNAVLKNKQVAIDWTVLNEKNVDSYVIERSTDGKTFLSIETMQPKGNSNIPQTIYNAQDTPPQYNTYYYRLKVMERGGSYHYSNIQSVVFDNTKPLSLNIFPNPTNNVLNIQFQSEKAQTVDFELFDVMGRRVYNYTLSAKEGDNRLYFHTHSFAAGLYNLRITQGRMVSVEKIVIK